MSERDLNVAICPHTGLPCVLANRLPDLLTDLGEMRGDLKDLAKVTGDLKTDLRLLDSTSRIVRSMVFAFVGLTMIGVITTILVKVGVILK